MSDPEIKADEWLAELERLSALPGQAEGLTRRELAEALGLGLHSRQIGRFLSAGCKAGTIIARRAMRPNIVGVPFSTVVYTLAPKGD